MAARSPAVHACGLLRRSSPSTPTASNRPARPSQPRSLHAPASSRQSSRRQHRSDRSRKDSTRRRCRLGSPSSIAPRTPPLLRPLRRTASGSASSARLQRPTERHVICCAHRRAPRPVASAYRAPAAPLIRARATPFPCSYGHALRSDSVSPPRHRLLPLLPIEPSQPPSRPRSPPVVPPCGLPGLLRLKATSLRSQPFKACAPQRVGTRHLGSRFLAL